MKTKKAKLLQELESRNLFSVNMGWRTLTIETKKGSSFKYKDDQVHGYVDEVEGKIVVADELDDESFAEVLLHEITHAILFFVGLGDEDETDKVTVTNEELTSRTTKGYLMFFKLNPELASLFVSQGIS